MLDAEQAGLGADEMAAAVGRALGVAVEVPAGRAGRRAARPRPAADGTGQAAGVTVRVPVLADETPHGYFTTDDAVGDLDAVATLVLHAAAAATARSVDLARRARDMPARSRSELLAELLTPEAAVSEELLSRARQLGIQVSGWHVVVRIEADDLDEAEQDEVRRFELLESAGQAALQAAAASGDAWYLSRTARAIILIRETTFNPGPQAGLRAVRSAERALQAIGARLPALGFRAGVGTAHEGATGLRASAAEARSALAAARAARLPPASPPMTRWASGGC